MCLAWFVICAGFGLCASVRVLSFVCLACANKCMVLYRFGGCYLLKNVGVPVCDVV